MGGSLAEGAARVSRAGARVSGYVLAGGRSSRMGVDKALVELGGVPLVVLALQKLRRIAERVAILAGPRAGPLGTALARYGPVVFDLHPGCGPLSGIEAALAASDTEWSLILPVDVPFLPDALLAWWIERTVVDSGARAAVFRVDGVLQPTVLLIHRELRAHVSGAIASGQYRVIRVLEDASAALRVEELPEPGGGGEGWADLWTRLSGEERVSRGMWFANVNTPVELEEARRFAGRD